MDKTILTEEIVQKAKKIKLVLTDVDGVLTDGKITFFPNDKQELIEIKSFNANDGIGFILLRNFGINTGFITGRKSIAAEKRANMLGAKYIYQGYLSKLEPLEDVVKREKVNYDEVLYIGDDIIDIAVLKKVGLSMAVPNAIEEVKEVVDFITKRAGGSGAIRELSEILLKAQGHWPAVEEKIQNADFKIDIQATQVFDGADAKIQDKHILSFKQPKE